MNIRNICLFNYIFYNSKYFIVSRDAELMREKQKKKEQKEDGPAQSK